MASGAGDHVGLAIAPPPLPPPAKAAEPQQQQGVAVVVDGKRDLTNPTTTTTTTKPHVLEHSVSAVAKRSAAKHHSGLLSGVRWDRLVRVLQLLTALDVVIPIVLMYRDGAICPYPIICARGALEIALLLIAKTSATLMYVPLAIIIGSKCATFRAFIQSTYVAEVIDLHGLHEMHVSFGLEVCAYAVLHVVSHILRLSIHNHHLFVNGGPTVNSGYPVAILFLLLVPPFASEFVRKRLSFEVRKSLHTLSIPALIALAFHHHRLHTFATVLLVAYSLDWLYSHLFKTYRVQQPYLFPVGTGTVIEFRPPAGFNFSSGQYLFINAPYISKYEWHPFSVIPITTADGTVACSLYALACGDWTKKLLNAARRNVRRPIWINGAHPSPFDMSIKFDYLFLICTGIGITPGISVISQYCSCKVIVLIWVCRDQDLIDLYSNELQVVNTKVFYTGKPNKANGGPTPLQQLLQPPQPQQKASGGAGGTRMEGNVMYCTGRPDMCQEIKNVILKKRPPDWNVTAAATPVTGDAGSAKAGDQQQAGSSTTNTQGSTNNTMMTTTMGTTVRRAGQTGRRIPALGPPSSGGNGGGGGGGGGGGEDPTSLSSMEAGAGGEAAALLSAATTTTTNNNNNNNTIGRGGGGGSNDQPFRRAMMDLYEVDRQEEVEHTEWLVLYCGASASLGRTLSQYCSERGIHFRTEFFGAW